MSSLGLEKKLETREPARARSGSVRLASLNEPEPSLILRLATLTSRAGSVRLASRLEARSKLLQLSLVSCQFIH
jgi:hypothetical protein